MYRDERFLKELAVYVKVLRAEFKLSQQTLADKIHIDRRQITRLETGENLQNTTINAILAPFKRDIDMVFSDITALRIKFDNQIKLASDLIYNQEWDEIDLLSIRLNQQFSDYQHISHYKQGMLFLKATSAIRKDDWEDAVPIYLEALEATQSQLILKDSNEVKLIDTKRLSTSVLLELEYGLLRQIATGIGCLGHYDHAIAILESLLISFKNEMISHDTKKLLTASIYASLAWVHSETDDTQTALHYTKKGIAYCHETGNIRSLSYLQNLQNTLRTPL